MQANETALDETPCVHSIPTVIIRIPDDETREQEEEVNSQIPVIDGLIGGTVKIGLKQVVSHYQKGCHTTQSIKDFVARFRCEVRALLGHNGCEDTKNPPNRSEKEDTFTNY